MKYGYARVSTDDQNPALQHAALKKAGCQTVFKDEGSAGGFAFGGGNQSSQALIQNGLREPEPALNICIKQKPPKLFQLFSDSPQAAATATVRAFSAGDYEKFDRDRRPRRRLFQPYQ
jgi:hypothetical protein